MHYWYLDFKIKIIIKKTYYKKMKKKKVNFPTDTVVEYMQNSCNMSLVSAWHKKPTVSLKPLFGKRPAAG